MPLRWDRRPSAHVPDAFSKGVARIAAVRRHPFRHARKAGEQRDCLRQLMRLFWRQSEGHRPAGAVGDHAGLGPIAATRAAKRFTMVSLR